MSRVMKLQIKNHLCRKEVLHLTASILKVCHVNAPSSECIVGVRGMGKAACWQWPTSWGTPKPQPRQAGSSAWPFSCQPHDLQLYEAGAKCHCFHPYAEIQTPQCRGKEQKIQQHRSLYSDCKLKMANSHYYRLLLQLFVKNGHFFTSSGGKETCGYETQVQNIWWIRGTMCLQSEQQSWVQVVCLMPCVVNWMGFWG